MFTRFSRAVALCAVLFVSAPLFAQAQPITAGDMMRHIEVLASDEYGGRAPATEGERRTTAYIVAELEKRGLEPAATNGGWLQAVPLIERRTMAHDMRWSTRGRVIAFDVERVVLIGDEDEHRIFEAPVVFVGHGAVDRARGIDQLAGADLQGAVALMLVASPDVPGFPSFEERMRAVAAAGAAVVIGVLPDEVPWQAVVNASRAPTTELATHPRPRVSGAIPLAEVVRIVRESGGDFMSMLNERAGPAFRAVPLNLNASFTVNSRVRRYTSNNVVGRIRGSAPRRADRPNESVLLLGHWDHLGTCGREGDQDRICNGAVDNASGIAMLIEIAGRIAAGPPAARDVLVLATTAEEMGLLGAEHFAAQPPVPLEGIVAALNFDTVAIHGTGQPVAVIGRGFAPLDGAIAATAAEFRRSMDTTYAADAFIRRQDG
ncbi:MAG TPA: M28 family peptidase, partial [Allosphingosinicella sp.]